MKFNEALKYLAEQAWQFHLGASPQVSTFAYLLEELVAREYNKATGEEYPLDGRLYVHKDDATIRSMLEEQLPFYEEYHPKTVDVVRLVLKHYFGETE